MGRQNFCSVSPCLTADLKIHLMTKGMMFGLTLLWTLLAVLIQKMGIGEILSETAGKVCLEPFLSGYAVSDVAAD